MRSALLIALALSLSACVSPWEESFEAAPGAYLEPLPPEAPVDVRRVPWERLDVALVELEREVIESDTHPSEWPDERLAARDGRLLLALQVSQPDARILGRSVFRSVDPIRPDDGQLGTFARQLGADLAIWSSRYQGKTTIVKQEPVTTYGSRYGGRGRYGYDSDRGSYISFQETSYVPVVIEADEYAWVAYYVRTR